MTEEQQVYQVINQIPAGRLCSHGTVAAIAGLAGRARWVYAAEPLAS